MAQAGTLGSNTAATRRLCRHSYACADAAFNSATHPAVLRVTQRARGGGQPGAVQVLDQAALRQVCEEQRPFVRRLHSVGLEPSCAGLPNKPLNVKCPNTNCRPTYDPAFFVSAALPCLLPGGPASWPTVLSLILSHQLGPRLPCPPGGAGAGGLASSAPAPRRRQPAACRAAGPAAPLAGPDGRLQGQQRSNASGWRAERPQLGGSRHTGAAADVQVVRAC